MYYHLEQTHACCMLLLWVQHAIIHVTVHWYTASSASLYVEKCISLFWMFSLKIQTLYQFTILTSHYVSEIKTNKPKHCADTRAHLPVRSPPELPGSIHPLLHAVVGKESLRYVIQFFRGQHMKLYVQQQLSHLRFSGLNEGAARLS